MSSMSTPSTAPSSTPTLPDALRLGAAHLTVTDLDRSVAWYQDVAGLRQHGRDGAVARLGAGGEDVLVLHEQPGARPAGRHAGLFHVALLYPSRLELSRTTRRLATNRLPLTGASDHGVSEALYLRDPDGNGIELYADRPRSAWPAPTEAGQQVGMYTRALDVEDLLRVSDGEDVRRHAAEGLAVGHLHLHVGRVAQAVAFYRDLVGFAEVTTYPGASFLSAGGYHHHLAVNVWAGEGVGPAPADAVGLREWSAVLPDDAAVGAVRARLEAAGVAVADEGAAGVVLRDPWGIALRLVTAR